MLLKTLIEKLKQIEETDGDLPVLISELGVVHDSMQSYLRDLDETDVNVFHNDAGLCVTDYTNTLSKNSALIIGFVPYEEESKEKEKTV